MLLSPRRVLPAFWTLYLGGGSDLASCYPLLCSIIADALFSGALASSLAALFWGRGNPRPTNGASGTLKPRLDESHDS